MKRAVAALALALTFVVARGGRACPELRAVNRSECPKSLDLDPCDTYGLRDGDLCEGDGECETDRGLDNCVTDDTRADVYEVVHGTQSIAAGDCPDLVPLPRMSRTSAVTAPNLCRRATRTSEMQRPKKHTKRARVL